MQQQQANLDNLVQPPAHTRAVDTRLDASNVSILGRPRTQLEVDNFRTIYNASLLAPAHGFRAPPELASGLQHDNLARTGLQVVVVKDLPFPNHQRATKARNMLAAALLHLGSAVIDKLPDVELLSWFLSLMSTGFAASDEVLRATAIEAGFSYDPASDRVEVDPAVVLAVEGARETLLDANFGRAAVAEAQQQAEQGAEAVGIHAVLARAAAGVRAGQPANAAENQLVEDGPIETASRAICDLIGLTAITRLGADHSVITGALDCVRQETAHSDIIMISLCLFILSECKNSATAIWFEAYMANRTKALVRASGLNDDEVVFVQRVSYDLNSQLRRVLHPCRTYRERFLSWLSNNKGSQSARIGNVSRVVVDIYLMNTDLLAFSLIYHFLIVPGTAILEAPIFSGQIRNIATIMRSVANSNPANGILPNDSLVFYLGYLKRSEASRLSWRELSTLAYLASKVACRLDVRLNNVLRTGTAKDLAISEDVEALLATYATNIVQYITGRPSLMANVTPVIDEVVATRPTLG